MRNTIARTLLAAIAVAPSALFAADPEYSVFVLPADTGMTAFVNGITGALSPDGRSAILKTRDAQGNQKCYRWAFGGSNAPALTLTGFPIINFRAVSNSGLAVGEIKDSSASWTAAFPASASAGIVTKNGNLRGIFNDLNDAGTTIVGRVWPTAPATNATAWYAGQRARKWTSVNGAAVNVLAGTTKADVPSTCGRVSNSGTWILGMLLNPTDLTAQAFIKNTTAGGEPVVIDAPFIAQDQWRSEAIANDGTAIIGWGNVDACGYDMAYLWSGTGLNEVVPSDRTYPAKDWGTNADLQLPLLGANGKFSEVPGKGLVGIVDVRMDAADAPNPNNTQTYEKYRYLASNGSLTVFNSVMPTIGVPRSSYPYSIEQRAIALWSLGDITTKGQILIETKFPNASTRSAAILTPAPVVSLTSSVLSKGEAGGTFTATVTRSAGPAGPVCLNWPLTVKLSYLGKAVRGTDYTAPLTVTIPAGQASATVTMNIVNDTEVEDPEAFTVRLVKPAPGVYSPQALYRLSGTQSRQTFVIIDNDTVVGSIR